MNARTYVLSLHAIAHRLRQTARGAVPITALAWAGHESALLQAAGELEDLQRRLDLLEPAQRWISAKLPPAANPGGPHLPVTVLGVVDDPMWRINGDEPFVDVVAYWPQTRIWTHTSCSRTQGPEGTAEAGDQPVRVRCWQPMVALPPAGSTLWD